MPEHGGVAAQLPFVPDERLQLPGSEIEVDLPGIAVRAVRDAEGAARRNHAFGDGDAKPAGGRGSDVADRIDYRRGRRAPAFQLEVDSAARLHGDGSVGGQKAGDPDYAAELRSGRKREKRMVADASVPEKPARLNIQGTLVERGVRSDSAVLDDLHSMVDDRIDRAPAGGDDLRAAGEPGVGYGDPA